MVTVVAGPRPIGRGLLAVEGEPAGEVFVRIVVDHRIQFIRPGDIGSPAPLGGSALMALSTFGESHGDLLVDGVIIHPPTYVDK